MLANTVYMYFTGTPDIVKQIALPHIQILDDRSANIPTLYQ